MTQDANIAEHDTHLDTHKGTSKRAPSRYVTSASTHLQYSFFSIHLFFKFSSDTIIVFHTYYAITGGREEAAVFRLV